MQVGSAVSCRLHSSPWLAGLTLMNINKICWLCMTGIQCWIRAMVSGMVTGGAGGVLKEQAAVYFWAFCLTQLQCQCALTEPTPVRWWASFEKWDDNDIDMEMWCSQNNVGLFYTLRQGENELHSKRELHMGCGEWKGRFRLTRNNSSGLPHDSMQHLSMTLVAIDWFTASICQTISEQITF